MKIKIFEYRSKDTLEDEVNAFIRTGCQSVKDIKFHVDEQVNPDWDGIYPTYAAMVIYEPWE